MVDWPMQRVQPRPVQIAAVMTGLVFAWAILGGLPLPWALALSAWTGIADAQPLSQPPPIEMTTLATRHLEEAPPDRRWVLRRGHPLNENAHAHAGGFIYAASGSTYLVVEDSQGSLMQQGQAAWAPEGIGHLHTTAFRASNGARPDDEAGKEIWTILLERETEARQPGAAAISPPLRGLIAGPYEARLVAMTFQPGAETSPRRRTGPGAGVHAGRRLGAGV